MNQYGDGYEAATEPGPDVELQKDNGEWTLRGDNVTPLHYTCKYRRPIKLRVGETYRCRNGVIVKVVELSDNGRDSYPYIAKTIREDEYRSYKANGVWSERGDSQHDIIEHIPKQPKENKMNKETITVNNVTLTHAQVQEAYDKMQKAKAENEIKVGDWVAHKDWFIFKVTGMDSISLDSTGWSYCKTKCKKLHPTPEQKAWLDSLIGGVE